MNAKQAFRKLLAADQKFFRSRSGEAWEASLKAHEEFTEVLASVLFTANRGVR